MRRIILFLFAVFVVTAWTLPSYAAETTFSGTWRVKAFALDNSDFDDNTADPKSYMDQRFRLGITSRASDDFGGFLETDGGNDVWGTGDTSGGVNINQAYLDFNVKNVNIKVGRQDFGVAGDIFNLVLIETFDAIVVSTQVGPATVYGGFIKLIECDFDGGCDGSEAIGSIFGGMLGALGDEDEVDDAIAVIVDELPWVYSDGASDDDFNVYVLGAQFMPTKGVDAGAFWVYAKDGLSETAIHWIGANGSFNAGPVDISTEGVILTGEFAPDDDDLKTDIAGWALVGDFSFSPNEQVGIGLLAGISSGDDFEDDDDLDLFFGLQPSFNQTDILLDGGDGGNGGATVAGVRTGQMMNLTIVKPYVTFKPMDQLALRAQWAWMKFTELPSGLDDEIGTELNLQADYTIHSASKLGLRVQANWFFPDDAFTGGSGQPDDTVTEYYARLQYEF